jgi:NAD(P)-dependent dehydrogenase (short-subunit alcohol dehydrogenase family)
MSGNLEGKVAIVTGAARGLGKEYAVRLAEEGVAIVVGDVRDCGETVAAVEGAGGRAVGVTLDVTDAASC